MRRRALLLGPDGQLGSEIRRAHAASGGAIELIPIARDKLDLAERGAVERVAGGLDFEVLVNCAGFTRVDDAEDEATLAFTVNAHAVESLARVCAVRRARFVHVSTDYVFGGDAGRRRPFREEEPTAPVNVYGASKAMGESLGRLACDDAVIVRTASLFGAAGAAGQGGNFVESVIRSARENGALRIVDDQTMSPTAAADVAEVVLKMLVHGCEPGLYHAVDSGASTWFDFAREILRRAGVAAAVTPCATRDYPARAVRPRYSVLDNARVSAAFGPMPAWPDALERYLRAKGHLAA